MDEHGNKLLVNGCKNVFIGEDDKQKQIVIKRIFSDDTKSLQNTFDMASANGNKHVLCPLKLLKEYGNTFYLTMNLATSNL